MQAVFELGYPLFWVVLATACAVGVVYVRHIQSERDLALKQLSLKSELAQMPVVMKPLFNRRLDGHKRAEDAYAVRRSFNDADRSASRRLGNGSTVKSATPSPRSITKSQSVIRSQLKERDIRDKVDSRALGSKPGLAKDCAKESGVASANSCAKDVSVQGSTDTKPSPAELGSQSEPSGDLPLVDRPTAEPASPESFRGCIVPPPSPTSAKLEAAWQEQRERHSVLCRYVDYPHAMVVINMDPGIESAESHSSEINLQSLINDQVQNVEPTVKGKKKRKSQNKNSSSLANSPSLGKASSTTISPRSADPSKLSVSSVVCVTYFDHVEYHYVYDPESQQVFTKDVVPRSFEIPDSLISIVKTRVPGFPRDELYSYALKTSEFRPLGLHIMPYLSAGA